MHYFDDGLGDTADSLRYFYDNRQHLGEIVLAHVTSVDASDHYPYTFELHDDLGNQLWLSGLGAGHVGDDTRAAMQVVLESGFDVALAQMVMTDSNVELRQFTLTTMCERDDDVIRANRFPDAASPDPGRDR